MLESWPPRTVSGSLSVPMPERAAPARAFHRARAAARRLAALARPARKRDAVFVCGLLVADIAFIAVFVAYAFVEHYALRDSVLFGNPRFSFVDGGYPEIFGYVKQFVIAALLLATYGRRRQPLYLALFVLFAATLIDDSIALHEAFGAYLSAAGAGRAGETAGFAIVGLLPLVAVALAYRRSDVASRRDALALLLGFALLLFFAIGVDVVHAIVHERIGRLETVFTVLEDGGELLTLTLLTALALGIFRATARPPAPE